MILLDLQGSGFDLYDPEIATASLLDEEDGEVYFCAGNLTNVAIEIFFTIHLKFPKLFHNKT